MNYYVKWFTYFVGYLDFGRGWKLHNNEQKKKERSEEGSIEIKKQLPYSFLDNYQDFPREGLLVLQPPPHPPRKKKTPKS